VIRELVALARPRHWIKGVFVLMPVPFSVAAGGVLEPGAFALGLLGFSLATSAVYAFNDVRDAAQDREHPDKRDRPVASGAVSPRAARLFALALLIAGLALVGAADAPRALALTATYVILAVVYSLWGRALPLVDVALLASFYVLRVLVGCALVGVVASRWLLLCGSSLALFLALAKRRGDLATGLGAAHRPSLSGYNLAFLDHALAIGCGVAILSYALYGFDADVLRPGRELWTLPPVVLGMLEYLRLVLVKGETRNPVDVVLRSPVLLLAGGAWVVTALLSLRT